MTLYLDTSLLVAAITAERATASVQDWIETRSREAFFISAWVATEVASALALKVRARQIPASEREDARRLFVELRSSLLIEFAVEPADFRAAGLFVEQDGIKLRAGDALHLAIASRLRAELCTLDEGLAKAGRALGIPTHLL